MGLPVTAHKPREALRKVKRQWDKFQRLRSAAGSGQFASDGEAVELVYQVVGSPSADLGKGKGKARDPAPRSARTRSTSVGRRKRAAATKKSSEEKENELENGVNQTERSSTAIKMKKRVSIVSDQDTTEDTGDNRVKNESPKSPKDTVSETPSGTTRETDFTETVQSNKPTDGVTEIPSVTMPVKDNDKTESLAGDRQIHESTDSGIESAVSRSQRRLKDRDVRELSSDGPSIGVEVGSNEESTGESVLSQSITKLKSDRGLKMPVVGEQDDVTKSEDDSAVAQTTMQTYEKEEKEHASGSLPSEVTGMEAEKKTPAGEAQLESDDVQDRSDKVPAWVPHIVAELSDADVTAQDHIPF